MEFTDPIFSNTASARAYLEDVRWSKGVYCPHCGGTERCTKLSGNAHRQGLFQCGDCRKQFTVTAGTIFERSKVPLNKWLMAVSLVASSQDTVSALQLQQTVGVTYKTAWLMFHRICAVMHEDNGMTLDLRRKTVERFYILKKTNPDRAVPAPAVHMK